MEISWIAALIVIMVFVTMIDDVQLQQQENLVMRLNLIMRHFLLQVEIRDYIQV